MTMRRLLAFLAVLVTQISRLSYADAVPGDWRDEWPKTDFSKATVALDEIMSGGPPRDGIPSIDQPQFDTASHVNGLRPDEMVISFSQGIDVRAYPLRIMMWHEIVNDTVGGVPVAITYCPLCNAAIVFDRRVGGQILDFGTTGKLRASDLVMYDRQTESWWQQFLGEAIVGSLSGTHLTRLNARLESWERFLADHPDGKVLVPNNPSLRDYGKNPYAGYDSAPRPFLYRGDLPENIQPMAYVVAIDDRAWSLELLRKRGRIEDGDTVLTWQKGASSALDQAVTFGGRDIGNVVAYTIRDGEKIEIPYDLTFAFVFHAFHPTGTIQQ